MAFDSAVLAAVAAELRPRLLNARINKIHQPDAHTLLLRWHSIQEKGRLLLCVHPNQGRIQLTQGERENPAQPPLFTMVLRKWLDGARITGLSCAEGERLAWLELEGRSELGDPIDLRLVIEIMGKHSNIILLRPAAGADRAASPGLAGAWDIIDGIRRYGSNLSRWREVLPGRPYRQPPPQGGLDLPPQDSQELAAALYDLDQPLHQALRQGVRGLSPLLSRQVCLAAGLSPEAATDSLGAAEMDNLLRQLQDLARMLKEGSFSPTLRCHRGRYLDFAVLPPLDWPLEERLPAASMNQAVELLYSQREQEQQLNLRRQALLKQVNRHIARLAKKIVLQEEDLARSQAAEQYKTEGDLLAANLWQLEKGQTLVSLPDFTEEGHVTTIELDPALTPQENVQLRFRRYAKARKARFGVSRQLEANREELSYIQSIAQALSFAETLDELDEPQRELIAAAYLAPPAPAKGGRPRTKDKAAPPLPPRSYLTREGFTVLIGRNNRQNDRLSLHQAAPQDIWLHTQKIPGSHAILLSQGRPVPQASLEQAAAWAAWFSQARDSSKVAVDLTEASRLHKPKGSRPGFVTYTGQTTLLVQPQDPDSPGPQE